MAEGDDDAGLPLAAAEEAQPDAWNLRKVFLGSELDPRRYSMPGSPSGITLRLRAV